MQWCLRGLGGEGSRELLFNGDKISVLGDEKNSGDRCSSELYIVNAF